MKITNHFIVFIIFFFFLVFLLLSFITLNNPKERFVSGSYTAVIIEPREHKALSFVLKNFLENLSDEWNILIMHGNKNIDYVQNIIENELQNYKNRIQMINLNIDNLTINEYNKLLTSETFYEKIPTEIFLIFQTDTMICKNQKSLINDFLQYDYVGAPWNETNVGGNGGLSLRKKSKMLEKLRNCNYNNENEDIYFSNSCSNLKFPTFNESKKFSVETVFNEKSFGVHKPWPYLSSENINTINNYCPGLNQLIELNK